MTTASTGNASSSAAIASSGAGSQDSFLKPVAQLCTLSSFGSKRHLCSTLQTVTAKQKHSRQQLGHGTACRPLEHVHNPQALIMLFDGSPLALPSIDGLILSTRIVALLALLCGR